MAEITVPQTSYTIDPAVAYPGMVADDAPRTVDTRVVATAAGIEAGLFVVNGSSPGTNVDLPGAAGDVTDKLMGVSLLKLMKEPRSPRYAQKDAMSVLTRGRVWVTIGPDGVSAGDNTLFVVHSGANAGKVQGVAGAGPAATVIVGGARCIRTTATLALIDLNLP